MSVWDLYNPRRITISECNDYQQSVIYYNGSWQAVAESYPVRAPLKR